MPSMNITFSCDNNNNSNTNNANDNNVYTDVCITTTTNNNNSNNNNSNNKYIRAWRSPSPDQEIILFTLLAVCIILAQGPY